MAERPTSLPTNAFFRLVCDFPRDRVVYAAKVISLQGADVEDERFEAAWDAHGPAVLRYCTYSTGSSHEGEDVAAETFARFLAKGDRVAPEHIEAWLIRVARNLCASHHRRTTRRALLQTRLAEHTPVAADGWVRPDSWDYVRRLSETERLVVYLRIAEVRGFSDIAALVGKSESATKMTFYRAIDRLRHVMQRDGEGPDTTRVGGADYV